jgi:hypothetical protein
MLLLQLLTSLLTRSTGTSCMSGSSYTASSAGIWPLVVVACFPKWAVAARAALLRTSTLKEELQAALEFLAEEPRAAGADVVSQ